MNKADRNTKTLIAKEIKGNRGDDNIDALLAFIENKETTKRNGVIGNTVNRSNIIGGGGGGSGSAGGDKNKKKNATKKEGGSGNGNGKLKKSNSLEELKSSSKLEEEIAQSACAQENVVTLRHKHQAKKIAAAVAETMKENTGKPQSKRGERRSWGTEELSYLGETNSLSKDTVTIVGATPTADECPPPAAKVPEKDLRKIVKDVAVVATKPANQTKRKEEHSLSIVSIESISTSSETAEFHVVTKKKKAKKRQILEEARQKQQSGRGDHSGGGGGHMHGVGHHRGGRYQPSHTYTNDRDVYLVPFNSNDNRRKSTSSVPPSEKSDSSDLDSVHSLPVESSSRLVATVQQTSTSSGSTPQASYADIARISNPDKTLAGTLPMDKWPVVSSKNPESPDTSNMSTCSSLSAKSQISVRANRFFPENIGEAGPTPSNQHGSGGAIYDTSSCSSNSSNSTIVKQVTYSQSLISDDKSISVDATFDPPMSGKRSQNIGVTCKLPENVSTASKSIAVGTSTATTVTIDVNKNPLQKSKSVDTDHSYTNMNIDNYPALEKTVKPQKQYQSMSAVEFPNKLPKSSARIVSSVGAQQQQQPPAQQQAQLSLTLPNSNAIMSSADNSVTVTITTKRLNKQQQTSTGHFGAPTKTISIAKAAANESNAESVAPVAFEQSKMVAAATSETDTMYSIANCVFSTSASVKTNTIGTTAASAHCSATVSTTKKSTKKDRNHHYTNNSNRPAVIILNDHSSNNADTISPLLFGDFEVEDLRLLEQESDHQYMPSSANAGSHLNISDDKSMDMSSIDKSMVSSRSSSSGPSAPTTATTARNNEPLASSPQSDLGYSSSHNRSAMSTESLETIVAPLTQQQQKHHQQQQNHQPQQSFQNYHQNSSSSSVGGVSSVNSNSVAANAAECIGAEATGVVPIDNIGQIVSNQSISTNMHNAKCNNYNVNKMSKNANSGQAMQMATTVVCCNSEPNNNDNQQTMNNNTKTSNSFSNINHNTSCSNSNKNTYTCSNGGNTNRNISSNNSSCGNSSNSSGSAVAGVHATATAGTVALTLASSTISTMEATAAVAATTATTTADQSTCTATTTSEEIFNQSAVTAPNWERRTTSEKELTIRYIAPPVIPNFNSYNHDKIVNFIGLGKCFKDDLITITIFFCLKLF